MQRVQIQYNPPSHGWLRLQLTVDATSVDIEASDVPNNPVQELLDALVRATTGTESSVWWHLEPDGYFMHFIPIGEEIKFSLEFAPNSKRSNARDVLSFQSGRAEVLLPFWRFLRDFQYQAYAEPHWPSVNYERILAIKAALGGTSEAQPFHRGGRPRAIALGRPSCQTLGITGAAAWNRISTASGKGFRL